MNQQKRTKMITEKRYKCSQCGHESKQTTNHYGETYSFGNFNCCPICPPYKRPTTWKCAESVPEGVTVPEPWTVATLSDLIVKTQKKK